MQAQLLLAVNRCFYVASPMNPITLLATAPLLLSLISCAHIGDAGMTLMASSVSAVAVVRDTLMLGKVVMFTDRTGQLTLVSPTQVQSAAPTIPRLTCTGSLHYTGTKTGVLSLRCNDGTEEGLTFTALSETRGVAQGSPERGPLSLVFDMAPIDAIAYLSPPAGQRLVLDPDGQPQLQPV